MLKNYFQDNLILPKKRKVKITVCADFQKLNNMGLSHLVKNK